MVKIIIFKFKNGSLQLEHYFSGYCRLCEQFFTRFVNNCCSHDSYFHYDRSSFLTISFLLNKKFLLFNLLTTIVHKTNEKLFTDSSFSLKKKIKIKILFYYFLFLIIIIIIFLIQLSYYYYYLDYHQVFFF